MKIILTLAILLFPFFTNAQCWQSIITGNSGNHSIAIKSDGTLYGWGENSNGQVGDNTTTDKFSPVGIGTFTDWKAIAVNGGHTMAVRANGELWGWGANAGGELGDGTSNSKSVPTRIGTATDWDTLAAGAGFTHAIKNDGTLWAWGFGGYNQLGVWAGVNVYTPTLVNSSTNWRSVSGGVYSAAALKTDGTLWQWGNGYYPGAPSGVPVQIGTDNDWKMMVHGAEHNLALKNDGTLWAWGNNLTGQLGDGTSGGVHTGLPKQIGTDNDWLRVSAGGSASFAIKTDGSLWGWGNNSYGQLGDGTITDKTIPTQIGTTTDWQSVMAGGYFTFALKNDGTLWTAGLNNKGQLGLGNNINQDTFTQLTCQVLPVSWMEFNAVNQNNRVNLQWKTSSERNTSYFDVERKSVSGAFIKIGSVTAAGNSNTIRNYFFTDQAPLPGKNFYRIRQVDIDNNYSYSEVRSATLGEIIHKEFYIFPVPAKSNLFLTIQQDLEWTDGLIIIRNVEGKTVAKMKLKNESLNPLQINVKGLPSGIYHLQFIMGKKSYSEKFFKE